MTQAIKALSCLAGGHTVALDVVLIQGIEHPRHWARLPGAPPYVAGVIDMHEQAVAVIDLGTRLGCSDHARPPDGPVILLESEEPVAVAVDHVAGVVEVDADSLATPPGALGAGIQGVAQDGLLLLDAEAIVDGRPLRALADVVLGDAASYPEGDEGAGETE
jgi:chemotaxis signal transduction protein